MSEENSNIQSQNAGVPRWVGLAVLVLATLSVVGLSIGWVASAKVKEAQATQETTSAELQALRQDFGVLGKRLEQSEERAAQTAGELSVVTDRLKLTQGELNRARTQAKQIREEYTAQLAEVENEVRSELSTKADAEEVRALSGDVSGVRTDLEETARQLNMSRGELGTLIARNSTEINQLRQLGTRDYFEFTLQKKGERARVGSFMLELRGTNVKRGQFTVAMYVDDMRLEKKNRSINEPIYFYTRGVRAPLELVINQVGKNKIVGYVSVPRSATASAGL